jgi:hypothetical protein
MFLCRCVGGGGGDLRCVCGGRDIVNSLGWGLVSSSTRIGSLRNYCVIRLIPIDRTHIIRPIQIDRMLTHCSAHPRARVVGAEDAAAETEEPVISLTVSCLVFVYVWVGGWVGGVG